MANPFILIMAAGAAVLLLAGKKKSKSSSGGGGPTYEGGMYGGDIPGEVPGGSKSGGGSSGGTSGGTSGGIVWPEVHAMMGRIGYSTGSTTSKAPPTGAVIAFQTEWNAVLTKMNIGKLKALPAMQAQGMLGSDGLVGPKTLSALGIVISSLDKGNMSNWKEVVSAAKSV